MIRTQIYLSEEHARVLSKLARDRGTTKAQLIRDAIEAAYLRCTDTRTLLSALAESAGAWKRRDSAVNYVERRRPGSLARSRAMGRK